MKKLTYGLEYLSVMFGNYIWGDIQAHMVIDKLARDKLL